MGPSHGLQFLKNWPSTGPFHMALSFRNILLWHGSHGSGMATVPARKSPPAWAPLHGLQLLLKFCSCMGSPWAAVSLRASPLILAWLSPQIAVWITLLQHQPQCNWPTCVSMVFSKGCRGTSAPVHGAFSPPPPSLTLISVGLFLSHSSPSLLSQLLHSAFYPFSSML